MLPTTGPAACPAGDVAQLTSISPLFPPDGFGPQLPRDASGSFHGTFTIPKTTPLGTYSIGVRCGGGTVGTTATLQVAATMTTTTTTTITTTTITTTTVPKTTTTTASTSTTVARSTTVPAGATTTITPAHRTGKRSSSPWWVGLALLALVLLIGAAIYLGRRGRPEPGELAPPG